MEVSNDQLIEALKENFGFDSFKGTQEEVIHSLLDGHDTFVIMPTGGGKSLCYQLPALVKAGTAIVISPLIALMKNQVDQLRSFHSDDRIAHFLNSSLTKKQSKAVKEDIVNGICKILYVAPETLVKEESIAFFQSVNISFVAVDEAHCISEWGHDFRPEYRRIKEMIKAINKDIPVIALTATATPKVRQDIIKNLSMNDARVFVSSFLRDNLHYEIRPKGTKENVVKQLVKFIKNREGQSGVIYALNRKTTEEIAELLIANGVNAAAYHAGLEGGMRAKVQDAFLMDDVDVICATIAFGMGIDKPDVRFVVHYDIPKSLENYYQETGRAGRDGLDGTCLAFFSFKDINKLEKFLKDKPVAEKEIAGQHLMEVVSYAESTVCRRKLLLHYFGENYTVPTEGCGNYCDNCNNSKDRIDVQADAVTAIKTVKELKENYTIPYLVDVITGKASQQIKAYKHDQVKAFGIGKDKDKTFWNSVLRNLLLENVLEKDIEKYGIIKSTPEAEAFLKKPKPFLITVNNNFEDADDIVVAAKVVAMDEALVKELLDLRKKVAKRHQLPPAIIFLETSINDMAVQYPITMEEMANITGVSLGKAQKYGKEFLELIKDYVEANEIDRPSDFVVKSSAKRGGDKIKIIQQIDKKLPFEEIEKNLNMNRQAFVAELEAIVGSGTKLDINYYLEDQIDEEVIEIIMDYFSEADNLDIKEAAAELEEDDISYEEIELVRIKFYSDTAN
ncbi:MAG: DNA helicase RecQ [Saprospiraceae bacterium]|nr:DNA helicase RecQ [Saprospiraceae bacterium]